MDSSRRSVVLFKTMSIPTSDPKSEFLCQLSLIAQNLQTPLEITLYAWDISHALVTTYHPYCHNPGALTEYLKQKLRLQWAKRLGRSLPAQVKPSVQLERNSWGVVERVAHVPMSPEVVVPQGDQSPAAVGWGWGQCWCGGSALVWGRGRSRLRHGCGCPWHPGWWGRSKECLLHGGADCLGCRRASEGHRSLV